MKVLTKNVYYYIGPDRTPRLWHDCKEYKKDLQRRIELKHDKENPTVPEDHIRFKCPCCDFSYDLDKHLELIRKTIGG